MTKSTGLLDLMLIVRENIHNIFSRFLVPQSKGDDVFKDITL
jgi:hypothetical protein